MRAFLKRASIVCGILFAALLCCGIVYIDNTKHYFYQAGGLVQMWVNTNYVFGVDTNTGRVGWGQTNTSSSFSILGKQPATNATGNGTSASISGAIRIFTAPGGGTFSPTTASGGAGALFTVTGGTGGEVPLATTNATGGTGGGITMGGGSGGMDGTPGVATNATTGGAGGTFTMSGGSGASPAIASTNTVGGAGGAMNFSAGPGGSPSLGWARKGGNGGAVVFVAGIGGNSVRTNGGNGGAVTITAGNAGSAATSPGDAGAAGDMVLTAGNGSTSTGTNSNGGHVYLVGGAPGSGAVPGNVIAGRNSAGAGNGGGFMVGISNSAVLTNVMFVRTNLDFPSTLAQTDADIPVLTIAGRTNAVVNVGPPPSALLSGVVWSGFCSNGVVFVRCSVYGALAKDPAIGDFEVEVKAYR